MTFGDRVDLLIIGVVLTIIIRISEYLLKKYIAKKRANSFLSLFVGDLKLAISSNSREDAKDAYNTVLANYPDFYFDPKTKNAVDILLVIYKTVGSYADDNRAQELDLAEIYKIEEMLK